MPTTRDVASMLEIEWYAMFVRYHELFKFFTTHQLKRVNFLKVVINALAPKIERVMKNSLGSTLRHVWDYVLIIWVCCHFVKRNLLFRRGKLVLWLKHKALSQWTSTHLANFGHLVRFIAAKKLLELIMPLVKALQVDLLKFTLVFWGLIWWSACM
mgnify:CR=1 FL=1